MSDGTISPVSATIRISGQIKDWQSANDFIKRLERQLADARNNAAKLEQELGKNLTPSDVNIGEVFNIWAFGDGLLKVECKNPVGFVVSWRKFPTKGVH